MKLNEVEASEQVAKEKMRGTEAQLAKGNGASAVRLARDFKDHTTAASSGEVFKTAQSQCSHCATTLENSSIVDLWFNNEDLSTEGNADDLDENYVEG